MISQHGTVVKRGAEPCCKKKSRPRRRESRAGKTVAAKTEDWRPDCTPALLAREGETEAISCRCRRQNRHNKKTAASAMLENLAGAEPKESVLTENKTEEPKNPPENHVGKSSGNTLTDALWLKS
jgi:hypothetical protein